MADNDFRVKRGIVVGTDAFISNSITQINSISFNTTQEFNPGVGSLAWDNAQGSISLGLSNTVDLQLGLKNLFYVKNQTGSTIFSNTVVMANGTVGNSGTILISPAIGNGNFPARYIMGVTAESIDNGEDGYVLSFGKLREINTSMFSEGDILYLDPANPGKMINTEPVAPSVKAAVAIVVTKHPTAGEIFVRPTFSDKLLDIQDVYISNNISNGQSIAWVSANSRFENMTISAEQSNVYNTYTTLTANDYNTLLAAYSNDYATLLSAQSNDGATLLTARSNDYNTLLAAYSNDLSTLNTARANDFNSYTTIVGLINTVQNNVAAGANTNIIAGNSNISNTTVFIEAGDGVLLSTNTTSKTLTIATSMSNVTSQTISISGTANSFTLTKAAANSNMVLVMYNGLVQDPSRYVISGSTLTLANIAPLIAGANIEIRYFDFFSLPGVTNGGGGGAYTFQGEVSGYSSGGATTSNIIDKFSFTADGNATDVGDLTQARQFASGQTSSNHGYTAGGSTPTGASDTIDKFTFASNANATDVGNLTSAIAGTSGQSSSTHGYASGSSSTQKFAFSSDQNATFVGNLATSINYRGGQSSTTSGYASGSTPTTSSINKFSFVSDGNATNIGTLTTAKNSPAGQSSTTHGYASGGINDGSTRTNIIDRFPFSTDTNASDVGDLTVSRRFAAGQSSTTSGYSSGGDINTPVGTNVIDKFPFASNANATDVGDLTQGRYSPAGQQV